MSLDVAHLRELVVRPALERIRHWSPAAEELVLATAAAESGLRHLRQLGRGPALGLWQMEPATHDDIWSSYLQFRRELAERVASLLARGYYRGEQLAWNLQYAAAMCRVHYLRDPQPLPEPSDVAGMAATWKRHYNTELGDGTIEHFVSCHRQLVGGA